LIVTGAGTHGSGRKALGEKFGVGDYSIQHHKDHHISAEYKAAVLAGPFRSEEDLRKIVAEEGISVLENLRGMCNAHRSRWLAALEAGDDELMIAHSKPMSDMLWKIGKLTREIAPQQTLIQNNTLIFEEHPEYLATINKLTAALRPFPEARQAVAAALRSLANGKSKPLMIEAEPAA
jgi:hypothetical protein